MNSPTIPNISCIRCTATSALNPGALVKEGDNWVPKNTTRPTGWIAGPVPLLDVTRGLCSKCAPDWEKMQKDFLTTPPTDPEVEVRSELQPITVPASSASSILQQRVGPLISTNIPKPASPSGPQVSRVPVAAAVEGIPIAVGPSMPATTTTRLSSIPQNAPAKNLSLSAPQVTKVTSAQGVVTNVEAANVQKIGQGVVAARPAEGIVQQQGIVSQRVTPTLQYGGQAPTGPVNPQSLAEPAAPVVSMQSEAMTPEKAAEIMSRAKGAVR